MAEVEAPRAKKGLTCPLHRTDMSKVCHVCPLWVKIMGKHPQSEDSIEHWNCSLAFLPMLLIENSQMQRQTGAAVESFRNETVVANQQAVSAMAEGIDNLGKQMHRAHVEAIAVTVTGLAQLHAQQSAPAIAGKDSTT